MFLKDIIRKFCQMNIASKRGLRLDLLGFTLHASLTLYHLGRVRKPDRGNQRQNQNQ